MALLVRSVDHPGDRETLAARGIERGRDDLRELPRDVAEQFTEYLDGPEGGTAFQLRVEYRWERAA